MSTQLNEELNEAQVPAQSNDADGSVNTLNDEDLDVVAGGAILSTADLFSVVGAKLAATQSTANVHRT